jgi:hypothetical protein
MPDDAGHEISGRKAIAISSRKGAEKVAATAVSTQDAPEGDTQRQAARWQHELPVLNLRAELLYFLQAGVGVSGLQQKRFEVAGVGVDEIALHRHRAVERQIVQFDGKRLGRVRERAVVVEDDDSGGMRVAGGESPQI